MDLIKINEVVYDGHRLEGTLARRIEELDTITGRIDVAISCHGSYAPPSDASMEQKLIWMDRMVTAAQFPVREQLLQLGISNGSLHSSTLSNTLNADGIDLHSLGEISKNPFVTFIRWERLQKVTAASDSAAPP